MKNLFLVLVPVFVLSLFAFSTKEKADTNVKILNNNKTPVFLEGYEYQNIDGTMFDFKQVKGKVLLLDFWASWCGPCVRQHSAIEALEKKINKSDFQVITISLDKDESKWKEFIAQNQWEGIHIKLKSKHTANPLNKMVMKEYTYKGKKLQRTSIPQYYLVDKNLSIEKIEDITAEEVITLIKSKL